MVSFFIIYFRGKKGFIIRFLEKLLKVGFFLRLSFFDMAVYCILGKGKMVFFLVINIVFFIFWNFVFVKFENVKYRK